MVKMVCVCVPPFIGATKPNTKALFLGLYPSGIVATTVVGDTDTGVDVVPNKKILTVFPLRLTVLPPKGITVLVTVVDDDADKSLFSSDKSLN